MKKKNEMWLIAFLHTHKKKKKRETEPGIYIAYWSTEPVAEEEKWPERREMKFLNFHEISAFLYL